MPQLYAPDLMKKLRLAMKHGGYKNLTEIAAKMGVKEPTLRSWAAHREERTAGTVSKKGREPLIRFFCAHLPHLSEQSVIDLLEGPYPDIANAFGEKYHLSLSQLISEQADFEGGKLYLGQGKSLFAARLKRLFRRSAEIGDEILDIGYNQGLLDDIVSVVPMPRFEPKNIIPIGKEFRLEFKRASRAKYFLGLQQTSQSWGVISASPLASGKIVHVPEPLPSGEPVTMNEHHDHGPSRFTLIQSMQPFPEFIYTNLRDGIQLSRTDIDFLARHLQELPKADRTLNAIDVAFIRD